MKKKILLAIFTITFLCTSFTNVVKPTDVEMLCNKTWIPTKDGIPDSMIRINFCSNSVYKMAFLYNGVITGDTLLGSWSMNNVGKIVISVNEFEKILYLSNVCEDELILKTENGESVEYSSKN